MHDGDIIPFGEIEGRSVSYKDKLSYNTTLQQLANRCLLSNDLAQLEINCEAFQIALYFDVEGLPFKSEITGFLPRLEDMTDEYCTKKILETELRDIRHPFYHPKVWEDLRAVDRFRIAKQTRIYHARQLLIYLLNLLARFEALMSAKDSVEVGSKGSMPIVESKRLGNVDNMMHRLEG